MNRDKNNVVESLLTEEEERVAIPTSVVINEERGGRQEQLSDNQDRGDVTIRRGALRVRVNSGSVMGDRRGQSPTETGGRRPGRAPRARGRGQNLRRGHSSRVQTSRAEAVTIISIWKA
ncbi:hypothetical protein GCK72_021566 [Caenorhabditis remanei]|uniref:Uncharacterized protein n=1 Tax=Caenorhabditis remanei TaxID=31234 RepID=A0A6A5GKY7_CAERE|nr:hypothetical protein GCK72_021566 [Caenorhabditis remanei]KAF1754999.1 hypothetical protein GCK72_021566 [Caenorhabditis remanei]